MPESIHADLHANNHVLYRFYSAKGQLLYVGITNDPNRRFTEHGIEKPWWPRVSDIKIERFNSRAELIEAELKAIRTENPRYNRAHASGVFEEVHLRRIRGRALCSDANRFGNFAPSHHPDDPLPPRVLAMQLPCPQCCGQVNQEADDKWQPLADSVHCASCGATWSDSDWRRAALGF